MNWSISDLFIAEWVRQTLRIWVKNVNVSVYLEPKGGHLILCARKKISGGDKKVYENVWNWKVFTSEKRWGLFAISRRKENIKLRYVNLTQAKKNCSITWRKYWNYLIFAYLFSIDSHLIKHTSYFTKSFVRQSLPASYSDKPHTCKTFLSKLISIIIRKLFWNVWGDFNIAMVNCLQNFNLLIKKNMEFFKTIF